VVDSVIAPPHAGCDDGVTPHVAEITPGSGSTADGQIDPNPHELLTIPEGEVFGLLGPNRSKRSVAVSIVAFPALVAVGLPLVVRFAGSSQGGIPASVLPAAKATS